jgi:hypothetical protein
MGLYLNFDISDNELYMINDILRLFIIQLITQILFYMRHDNIELFSTIFLENVLFLLIGVFVYWMVFDKFVFITNKNNEDKKYQKIYTK